MRKKSANANQKQTNQHSSNQRPGVGSAAQYPLSQQSAQDGLRGVYRDDPEKEGRESNEYADQSHHRNRCANQNPEKHQQAQSQGCADVFRSGSRLLRKTRYDQEQHHSVQRKGHHQYHGPKCGSLAKFVTMPHVLSELHLGSELGLL